MTDPWAVQIAGLMRAPVEVEKPIKVPYQKREPVVNSYMAELLVLLAERPHDTSVLVVLTKASSKEVVRQRLDRLRDMGLVSRQLTGATTPAIWSVLKKT